MSKKSTKERREGIGPRPEVIREGLPERMKKMSKM